MLANIKFYFLPFLFLFFYIYPLYFFGIPFSTRVILGVLGFLLCFMRFRFFPSLFSIFKGAAFIVIISICSALLNYTFDFFFASYVISVFLIFMAAYLFTLVFPNLMKEEDCFSIVLYLFVWTVCLQSFLAMVMFLSPELNAVLNTIFPLPVDDSRVERLQGFRLMGLGIVFFGAGVINGLAMITIIYLYLARRLKHIWCWSIIYMFIFLIGMLMARTTIVGFAISILLLALWRPLHIPTIRMKFKWGVLMVLMMVVVLAVSFAVIDEQLLRFAFEFWYNMDETGSFESASTNDLKRMYSIMPTTMKTWLIGDGRYNMPGGGYYMGTDIGFYRLIFYGGIPIMLAFYYFSWYIIRRIRELGITPLQNKYLIFSFIYLVVLGFKGLADLNSFFLLLFIICYRRQMLQV
ncbi:hypothetical protein AAE250_20285 [Bacteroides sp. GD17]|jgi:hypothetical protein